MAGGAAAPTRAARASPSRYYPLHSLCTITVAVGETDTTFQFSCSLGWATNKIGSLAAAAGAVVAATDVLVELRRNSIAFVSMVNRRKRVAAAFSAATDGTHTQQLSQGRRMMRLFVCSVILQN